MKKLIPLIFIGTLLGMGIVTIRETFFSSTNEEVFSLEEEVFPRAESTPEPKTDESTILSNQNRTNEVKEEIDHLFSGGQVSLGEESVQLRGTPRPSFLQPQVSTIPQQQRRPQGEGRSSSSSRGGGISNPSGPSYTGGSTPQAPSSLPSSNPSLEESSNIKYWLQTGEDPKNETLPNTRHNRSCKKFLNVPGKPCQPDEGEKCPICGG